MQMTEQVMTTMTGSKYSFGSLNYRPASPGKISRRDNMVVIPLGPTANNITGYLCSEYASASSASRGRRKLQRKLENTPKSQWSAVVQNFVLRNRFHSATLELA